MYKPGLWKAICDVCGFEFYSNELRKRWDGLMVCDKDFECDHPSKYLRAGRGGSSVPWVRSEPEDTFVYVCYLEARQPYADQGEADCARVNDALAPAPGTVDQYFNNVLILANGAGRLVDSSSYNRTLTSSGGLDLDNTYPLNGRRTYRVPTNGKLICNDVASVLTLLGTAECCLEFYLRWVADSPFGISAGISTFAFGGTIQLTTSEQIRLTSWSVGGVSMSDLTSTNLVGSFDHIAIIRDNTSDPNWTRIHIAKNGVIVATSTENLPKSGVFNSGSTLLMGFDLNSPSVVFGGYRLTRNTRRYLITGEGDTPNTFVPDTYPFADRAA